MRYSKVATAAVAVMGALSCRDGLDPYEAELAGRADSTEVVRLTLSPGNDAYPTWSPDGSTVVYTGAGFAGIPSGQGLLLEQSRGGGTARLVFAELQGPGAGGPRWLAGSAVEGDESAVAYVQMAAVATPLSVDPTLCPIPEPVLDSVVVRVRRRAETGSILADPAHELRLPGRDPDVGAGGQGPFELRDLPFQQRYRRDGTVAIRPSWAPDGRVVFSDGLTLWIWTPGAGPPTAIPGVEDAVTPAWSPDGSRIAYTRLERGDSTRVACNVLVGNIVIQQIRTTYAWPRSTIVVVGPDGTGKRELADGTDPAWSPDGGAIYYRGMDAIERIPSEGGATEAVAGTEGGWWPAVSPDGARLLFMRKSADETWDIWSAPLSR